MSTITPAARLPLILAQRARKLAAKPEVHDHGKSLGTFAVVVINGRPLGLPVIALREIVRTPPVTPLPNLPPWLSGVALVRGGLVTVLDIGLLFEVGPAKDAKYLAVLAADRGDLAVLINRVVGFRQLNTGEVLDGAADPAAGSGLPSLGTTRDLVTLLDVQRLFNDERIIVDQNSGSAWTDSAAAGPTSPAMAGKEQM